MSICAFAASIGSPPRMRGKVAAVDAYHKGGRITPAHAGKRLLGRLPGMGGPDHPRACGEKTPVRFYENGVPGSPPRMRGKEEDHHQRPGGGRITPAHAGKRICPRPGRMNSEDHPRACGEKSISRPKSGPSTGSPPRMRRKDVQNLRAGRVPGITPAYAGKSTSAPAGCPAPWDHPRVCGEKLLQPQKGLGPAGSPPCMRGKEVAVLVQ